MGLVLGGHRPDHSTPDAETVTRANEYFTYAPLADAGMCFFCGDDLVEHPTDRVAG